MVGSGTRRHVRSWCRTDWVELAGPTAGVVELPTHLAWSGLRTYDLADDRQFGLLYGTVIREAMDAADLDCYLSEALLRWTWPKLWLPARIRRVWERRFPGLALAARIGLAAIGRYGLRCPGVWVSPAAVDDVDLFTVADAQDTSTMPLLRRLRRIKQ